ncbi:hydantoinase/oxoprolinase N-terminal domain-containing protein [Acidisphaera sp. S103]|uniref:hydantoinase/oxoprolinase N-terminal domain-containing protein n=1 Tax=Acidisphaera sp. S103 TaxID=1747223 RepID=UPI001C20BAFE|nr:hydantoinase/oxoprolinase N-terminal domain-containing protein [Acidisphaera sp. S103]
MPQAGRDDPRDRGWQTGTGRQQAALETARNDWGVDLARITRFTHGTTAATNAALERRGARIGLITTQGFGSNRRPRLYRASPRRP